MNDHFPTTIPTHDDIAQRAHQRFLDRGSVDGRHEEDWLAAERDLIEPFTRVPAQPDDQEHAPDPPAGDAVHTA